MFYCFVDPSQISGGQILITEGNFHHLKNVMHAAPGEHIRVRSDRYVYECEIIHVGRSDIRAQILTTENVAPEYKHSFIAAVAILQEKRFDLLLQTAVQLGVSEIHPVITRNAIFQEIKPGRSERWRKIVHSACMQSQRIFIPSVEEPADLESVVRRMTARPKLKALAAYELEEKNRISGMDFTDCDSIAFFTGPEGGFTNEEAGMMSSSGVLTVTLGPNILRAETAALVTFTLLQQKLGYL
jgi:16S rRNA (uracil1498-N3)-methyltransferase